MSALLRGLAVAVSALNLLAPALMLLLQLAWRLIKGGEKPRKNPKVVAVMIGYINVKCELDGSAGTRGCV